MINPKTTNTMKSAINRALVAEKKLLVLLIACMMTMGAAAQHYPDRHPQPHPHPQAVERHHHGDPRVGRHDRRHEPQPMPPKPCATPRQMHMVMQTIKGQSFDDKKLEIAQLCVTIGQFCTDDLALMAKEFSFDEKRLEFLQYAYSYCTDRERYPVLQDCFTFRTNYDKLMQTIYAR